MKRLLTTLMTRFLRPRQAFSLGGIDAELARLIPQRSGFFIEAGANDGVTQSNTLYFEKYRGWRGLLIEPIPELAVQCRVRRPKCLVENCALVPFDYAGKDIVLHHYNLMSFVDGALKTAAETRQHEADALSCQELTPVELRVPARTLTAVLDQHRVKRIDLLSLDVEGFELSVLRGLDFDRFAPRHLLVEARYREELDAFLAPRYDTVAELGYRDVLYRLKTVSGPKS